MMTQMLTIQAIVMVAYAFYACIDIIIASVKRMIGI